jgi:hypothetical protein
MGKKSDTAKPPPAIAESPASTTTKTIAKPAPEPAVAAAKPEAVTKPVAPNPPAMGGNGAPAKTAAKKKPAKKAAAKKTVTFTTEDIALRAYFIAEHRQRHGLHGDSHSDWIEAERQLKKESRKKPAKKKKPAAKKRV